MRFFPKISLNMPGGIAKPLDIRFLKYFWYVLWGILVYATKNIIVWSYQWQNVARGHIMLVTDNRRLLEGKKADMRSSRTSTALGAGACRSCFLDTNDNNRGAGGAKGRWVSVKMRIFVTFLFLIAFTCCLLFFLSGHHLRAEFPKLEALYSFNPSYISAVSSTCLLPKFICSSHALNIRGISWR